MTELPRSRPASSYQERADALLALMRSDFGFPHDSRTVIADTLLDRDVEISRRR